MRLSCLINNYNYSDYVVAAVESALAQTRALDEIIVVDDGSTDNSREVLQQRFGFHPTVRLLFKENGGQLSCFNTSFSVATGDILFFLDADDTYEPGYVAAALKIYEKEPVEFIFCAHRKFGAVSEVVGASADRNFGYTRLYTWFMRKWIGGPTSCLSAKRTALAAFLPLPQLQDWRVRADDCLVFGASLTGARKYKLGQPLVNYRIHARNNFHGRGDDLRRTYLNEVNTQRLFDYLSIQDQVNFSALSHLAWLEFCTKPQPTIEEFRHYLQIFWRSGQFGIGRKLRYSLKMWKHLLSTSLRDSCKPFKKSSGANDALRTS